ncbi:MAG TPA: ion transporter [Anaeromyxobacteraceae bacterium]|nr:ion transporter [Anaeromyxobacteraceae bacterium]
MSPVSPPGAARPLRARVAEVIFGHDTFAGKAFDVLLILAILASVTVVALETVAPIREEFGPALRLAEWFFTLLFTAEYAVRLWCTDRPGRYARSFFGVVDLVSILPTYLSLFLGGAQALLTIRALRLLRIFRVLKLGQYTSEASHLGQALARSRQKITVFLAVVLTLVLVLGSLMYLVEGPENGFTSIPRSIYWAIVTLTTVGYGDITPHTVLGQVVAALAMILGYGIIAVPTGIVTVELGRGSAAARAVACRRCGLSGHDADARHCKRCGEPLG